MADPENKTPDFEELDLPGEPPAAAEPSEGAPSADEIQLPSGGEEPAAPAAEEGFALPGEEGAAPLGDLGVEAPAEEHEEEALPAEAEAEAVPTDSEEAALPAEPLVTTAEEKEEEEKEEEKEEEEGEKEEKKRKRKEKWGRLGAALLNTSPYTIFLGLSLLAVLLGIYFLMAELKRYNNDIKAEEVRQRQAMAAPAVQPGPPSTTATA